MKSVYIHIPFCSNICTYCDFCKMYYNEKWVDDYLNSLNLEIKSNYKGEIIETIYIGGGTPSCLNTKQLIKLFDIIKIFKFGDSVEFTFECNIENIDENKLLLLKKNNVNRLSIGVQTFNNKFLNFLNRRHTKEEVFNKINLSKKIGFNNINIDLIYALENQSIEDLNNDLDLFLKLDIDHISTYSLIIEPNTILSCRGVENIDEDLDYKMYKLINKKLTSNDYRHYEVSNYAKKNCESKHNLVYWNNNHYYGFGLGASGYIANIRYTNTRSLNNYLKGKYILDKEVLTEKEILENEFILGFRKIDGINKDSFYKKYNIKLENNQKIIQLLKEGKLIETKDSIKIHEDYIYTMNSILINFIGD